MAHVARLHRHHKERNLQRQGPHGVGGSPLRRHTSCIFVSQNHRRTYRERRNCFGRRPTHSGRKDCISNRCRRRYRSVSKFNGTSPLLLIVFVHQEGLSRRPRNKVSRPYDSIPGTGLTDARHTDAFEHLDDRRYQKRQALQTGR